jgi:hypothetical protein
MPRNKYLPGQSIQGFLECIRQKQPALKIRVFLLLTLVYWIGTDTARSQTFTTPEVFSYKQEPFRPISYYTGQANISVPIFEVKTSDITIPVTLNYIGGEGLRAINPYSCVGLGWKISAGGVVTRSKNGVCDEHASDGGNDLDGFFRMSLPISGLTNDYVRNQVNDYVETLSNGDQYYSPLYEYSPDVFSFSFLGYSGFFVLGYDGQFKIQSQDIVKVEKGIPSFFSVGAEDLVYFTLTANDGTKYIFGYDDGSIEFSGGENAVPFQSEAWYLTQIRFPNGRNVKFKYKLYNNHRVHFYTNSTQTNYLTQYPVVLDSITFKGGKVWFRDTIFSQNIAGANDQLKFIRQIDLLDGNNNGVSKANFKFTSYTYNRYYILDSLRIDSKRYAFGYNLPSSLPTCNQAFGTDYWGFYNGQYEVQGHIGPTYRDAYLNQRLTIPGRIPSEACTKTGILTSLTYPTGETEYYEYELNKYSRAGMMTLDGYYPGFSPNDCFATAGGLRISKITRGNQVRKYKYFINFVPTNPDDASCEKISSGYIYKLPAVASYSAAEALNFLSIEGEPSVTYSKVIEYLRDKSYTEYNFNSPLNRPDGQNYINTNYYSVSANLPEIFSFVSQQTFVGALGKNSSCSLERGNTSVIRYYNSSNQLLRTVRNYYSSNSSRYNDYVASVYMTSTAENRMAWLGFELGLEHLSNSDLRFSVIHSYCIYTFPEFLEKEVTTDFIGTDSIQYVNIYRYNSQKLKSTEVTYDSRGDSVRSLYRYPADINVGSYASMKTKNILNIPIEVTYWKKNKITGGVLTTYKANNGSYVPDQFYKMEVTTPFSSMNPNFDGTNKDTHYGDPEITYVYNSTKVQVRQKTGRDGVSTAYLWDSNENYPIAQVKGANYSTISSLDAKSCNYSSSTLWSEINGLNSSTMITTYSYFPLIGVAAVTNPANVTTKYTYDKDNRLYLVRNDDNSVLQRYRYAYKNYPDNGRGGYGALTGSITVAPAVVVSTQFNVTVSTSGGSGSFLYNWYLKNSSGTVVASYTNSNLQQSFTCTSTGSYTVQCVVVDNLLGNNLTLNTSSFTCCVSICNFSMSSGYISLTPSYNILGFSTTVSFYITFYSTSDMQPNVSYLIATVSSSCRPSSTRVFNINSIMGRAWEITINSNGNMYWRMTQGTTLPAFTSESTGTLTYNK